MKFEYKAPNIGNAAFAEMMGANNKDIKQINISELTPYPNQPFKGYAQSALEELAEDIKENGVLSPVIVRPLDNAYQILAGHNRVNASRLAGLDTVPCIIKDVDDDTAKLIVVNTNLNQRQELLPSEKAFAYKMQYEALKKQGKRDTSSSGPMVLKSNISENSEVIGENARQVRRYIRLTQLITPLLDMVDSGILPFRAGVELSYLNESNQTALSEYVEVYKQKLFGQG